MLLDEQLAHKEKYGQFVVDKYMPPVAGALRWTNNLYQRIQTSIEHFKSLQDP